MRNLFSHTLIPCLDAFPTGKFFKNARAQLLHVKDDEKSVYLDVETVPPTEPRGAKPSEVLHSASGKRAAKRLSSSHSCLRIAVT